MAALVSFLGAVARQTDEPLAVKIAAAILAGVLTLTFTALAEAILRPDYLWAVGVSGALGYAGADFIAKRTWRLLEGIKR